MLSLVALTTKTIEIPAPQMSRSCTENFGDQNFLPEIVSESLEKNQ